MTKDLPIPRWWRDALALRRVLADLLAGELAAMRPGLARPAPPWREELDLRTDAGADSLELMGLASAMEQMLGPGRPAQAPLLARTRLGDWLAEAEASLEQGGDTIVFRTSGSTGARKAIAHPLALLWQEAAHLATLFEGRRRIVSMVPSHHIYGFLFTVLLPRALGLRQSELLDLRTHPAGGVGEQLRAGDLVVGHPDFWRAFGQAARSPAGVVGVSSTAPCPAEVARAAVAAGLERLAEVYGSSETGGVGWRDDPDADFTLFPYWSHAADPPLAMHAAGAMAGERPAQLLRHAPDGSSEAIPLQDRLEWSSPRRFRPLGRVDHAVQIGGTNVFPGYVAEVLRMHAAVRDAVVRPMRADEGHRLKAFVVAHEHAPAPAQLRTELDAWMRERVCPAECPAAYSFGQDLPRQASGKPADWIIDAWP